MGLHDPLVIVGAGVFGLSTALELRKRSYTNVTVLDRFMPPVPDGSSVDISRIIRMDYSDPLYGRLAREAHALWKSAYKDHFHESGFVMYGDRQSGSPYLEKVKAVNAAIGNHVDVFDDANDIRGLYPNIQANLDGLSAVHNPKSG